MINFIDFYITNSNEPTYTDNKPEEDDIIEVIIQKYKMILFTNKGELLGDPNFGGDMEYLLFETKVSDTYVIEELTKQIIDYIPELMSMNYTLDIVFTQDPNNFYDIMTIKFSILDTDVYAQFGKSIN